MLTRTVHYKDAVLTIGRENVRSRLLRGMVYRHFDLTDITDEEFQLVQGFVTFLTQVRVEGDVGFAIPSVSADKKVVLAAYDAFLDMPAEFFDAYIEALMEVDSVIGDPDTTIGAAKKKAAKS